MKLWFIGERNIFLIHLRHSNFTKLPWIWTYTRNEIAITSYYYDYYWNISSRGVWTCLCCVPLAPCWRCDSKVQWLRPLRWSQAGTFAPYLPKWLMRNKNVLWVLCLQFSRCLYFHNTEYAYYTHARVFTYKCAVCVRTLRSQRKEDMSVRLRPQDLPKNRLSRQYIGVVSGFR